SIYRLSPILLLCGRCLWQFVDRTVQGSVVMVRSSTGDYGARQTGRSGTPVSRDLRREGRSPFGWRGERIAHAENRFGSPDTGVDIRRTANGNLVHGCS